MKILHVITSLRTGGAEHLMVDLLPRLQQQGHEVALFLMDGTITPFMQQLESYNIPIIISKVGGNVYAPHHIWHLRKILPNFDIIHTHNTSPQLFTAIANIGLHRTLITTEHNTDNHRRSIPIYKPIDQWMYQQYQQIICISNATQEALVHYLPTINSIVINNGIDVNKFATAQPIIFDNIPTYTHIGAMIAAFRWEKDQETIIRAYSLLEEKYHLLLVGGGDEKLISKNKELAKQLGISHRIHFLGIQSNIPEILKSIHVAIQSSHIDGFGLVAVEAMASGVPIIASQIPGLGDIVNRAGLLFPHKDYQTLAQLIKRLGEDPTFSSNIATRCQRRALDFDISKMVEKYNAIYERFL